MYSFFDSKVYLVTGGNAGIGLAITSLLQEYGAYVYVMDIIQEPSTEFAALPRERITYLQGDVKDRKRSHEIVELITKRHKRLDGLVNNAALCLQEGEIPDDDLYDPLFDVNIRGAWNLGTEALAQMKPQGDGSIVNIGSLASLAGERRLPIYTATKHALAGFTKTWALDYAKYGIRVNMVAPGNDNLSTPLNSVMLLWYSDDPNQALLTQRWFGERSRKLWAPYMDSTKPRMSCLRM